MMSIPEVVGLAIITLATAYALPGFYFSLQRNVREARFQKERLDLFRERARIRLDAERADRDRELMSWNGWRKFTIDKKVTEADDICSVYLVAHDEKPLAPYLPGQFLTFNLRIPGQSKPVTRCYSLSDSPDDLTRYRVTIKRLAPPADVADAPPGRASSFFHDDLGEGDIVDVRAPAGQFHVDPSSTQPVVLVAGGVGISPVLSMLNAIGASGDRREAWLFYGVRKPSDLVQFDHLQELERQHPNIRVVICYSQPVPDDALRDQDHLGHASVELFKKRLSSNNYAFYVCGPPSMMETLPRDLEAWGVPSSDIHFEAFGPASVPRKRDAEVGDAAGSATSNVVFARFDKSVAWSDEHDSLLDLAEANGVPIDAGCRAGNCGTCVTAIRSGSVRYLNEPGSEPESGTCLACISVPDGELILDA